VEIVRCTRVHVWEMYAYCCGVGWTVTAGGCITCSIATVVVGTDGGGIVVCVASTGTETGRGSTTTGVEVGTGCCGERLVCMWRIDIKQMQGV
jgi:hypothetical protein